MDREQMNRVWITTKFVIYDDESLLRASNSLLYSGGHKLKGQLRKTTVTNYLAII